jgi:universal stress protein A
MFHPRHILCPTDLSESSLIPLQVARDLARQYQATLLVLHVADTLGPEHLGFAEAETQLQPEGLVAELEKELHGLAPAESGLVMQYLLREGDAATVVEQVVREHHCDLVVVGSHGRTGLEHLFRGSTSEKIIRRCACPVLVVKYPHGGV